MLSIDELKELPASLKTMAESILRLPNAALNLAKLGVSLAEREKLTSNHGITLAIAARRMAPESEEVRLMTEWALSKRVPRWHFQLVNDDERNSVYDKALRQYIIPDKSVVLEIGTGSGILAMMAARAGAAHVYTCEMEPLVAEAARRNIEKNGLSEQITVISKKSFNVQIGVDMPEKADILVSEIVDDHLLGEDVIPIMADVKERLIKVEAKILPEKIAAHGVLVGGETWRNIGRMNITDGFTLSEFNWLGPSSICLNERQLIEPIQDTFSAPTTLLKFDFGKIINYENQGRQELDIHISRTGSVYGLVRWLHLDFGEGIAFDNQPPKQSVWRAQFHVFSKSKQVSEGTTLKVEVGYHQKRIYIQP